eukprot:TRINITY_DN202_c0_g1_i1.p1 TRINITY_DN202_c0_g1~~TRINITY_DN202_c0_g1_i1.p1  ORF type:complete len:300 (-),score=55.47 TRINITY_DN202_c0_g1_i1:97-996(-)
MSETETAKSVTFKVQYGDEIRRFDFLPETYDSLEKEIRSIFKLDSQVQITLTYIDSDGDVITFSSDKELSYALQLFPTCIRLQVTPKKNSVYTPPFARPVTPVAPLTPVTSENSTATPHRLTLPSTLPEVFNQIMTLKEHARFLKRNMKMEDGGQQHFREMKRSYFQQHRGGGGGGDHWTCWKLSSRFVKHVTAPDGVTLPIGFKFTKTWKMANSGAIAWPEGTTFLRVSRLNDFNAPPFVPVPQCPVAPNQEVDISVEMTCPNGPGLYESFWRLVAPSGKKFGQRVRVQIQVCAVIND